MLLLILVPTYGILADRLPRRGLLNAVTAFFVLCLVAFYGLTQANVPVGVVFFLWVGIFSLMIVAQFWSFANDLYTKEQGERLFVIVAFGMSLGAVMGSILAAADHPVGGRAPSAARGGGPARPGRSRQQRGGCARAGSARDPSSRPSDHRRNTGGHRRVPDLGHATSPSR